MDFCIVRSFEVKAKDYECGDFYFRSLVGFMLTNKCCIASIYGWFCSVKKRVCLGCQVTEVTGTYIGYEDILDMDIEHVI